MLKKVNKFEVSAKITQDNWKKYDPSKNRKSYFDYFEKKKDKETILLKKHEYAKFLKQQIKEFENKKFKSLQEEKEYDLILEKKIEKDLDFQYNKYKNEMNFETPIKPLNEQFDPKNNDKNENEDCQKNDYLKTKKILNISNFSVISKKSNKYSNFLNESVDQGESKIEKENYIDDIFKTYNDKSKKENHNKNENETKNQNHSYFKNLLLGNEFTNNLNERKESVNDFKINDKLPLGNRYDILDNLKKSQFKIFENQNVKTKNFLNFDFGNKKGNKNEKESRFDTIWRNFNETKFDCDELISGIEKMSQSRNNFKILSIFN